MGVTIRDVARVAGVSVSTVSLALNSPGRVSEATRGSILRAADELGFVPKAEAVARARRGAGRVGLVGPFSSYDAAGRRLAGVLRAAAGQALDIVVFDQPSSSPSPAPLLSSLPRTGRLDGLIVTSLPLDDLIVTRLDELGLATVLLDRSHPGLSSVRTDNGAGGRLAAQHLLERGHRHFGFLGEAQRTRQYVSPAQERLAGYRAALADAGHPVDDDRLGFCEHHLGAATVAARALLIRDDRPSAVFAADDLLAAGVLAAARGLGLSVPGDVAVVGYDDGDLAAALGLSTVRQPLLESGALALGMLRELMAGPHATRDSLLAVTFTQRESS